MSVRMEVRTASDSEPEPATVPIRQRRREGLNGGDESHRFRYEHASPTPGHGCQGFAYDDLRLDRAPLLQSRIRHARDIPQSTMTVRPAGYFVAAASPGQLPAGPFPLLSSCVVYGVQQ